MPYYCSSGAIVLKAGKNCNQTAAASGAVIDQFSQDAMGYINARTRFDWIANSGAVGTNFKFSLQDAESSIAGIMLATYDPSGYTSRSEYEDIINVLWDRAEGALKVIADEKLKTKMGVST